MNITPKDLLDAGVHFGHQVRRWNPNFKPFLFDHRNGISIIDLEKTFAQLELASEFLTATVKSGKNVLFVGTKRQAQEIIREAASETRMPFCVNRWMGGTLTNFATIKSSLQKYRRFLSMEKDGSLNDLPKKEGAAIRRQMIRMNRNFEGILDIEEIPSALFVVDVKNEEIAVEEAQRLGIPVIGLVDTNSDPSLVDFPIPGNDDAAKSIRIVVEAIIEAIQNGLESREAVAMPKASGPMITRNTFSEVESEGEVTLPKGFTPEEEDAAEAK
ncbi:MAG: 30S ribosomal protein S2 [Verrucomicrobiota bacterium]